MEVDPESFWLFPPQQSSLPSSPPTPAANRAIGKEQELNMIFYIRNVSGMILATTPFR